MKLALALALPLALNASPVAPYWSVQLGAVRGDEIGPLDQRLGPQVALHYTFPLSEKQELRAGLEAFWINGKSVDALIGPWGGWPPQTLDAGQMRRTVNAQLLSFDYRLHFLRGGTGPYFVTGLIGGRLESSFTFQGGAYRLSGHDSSLKGGGSVGFGMQFRRTFAVELRARYLNGADEAGHFLLGLSARF